MLGGTYILLFIMHILFNHYSIMYACVCVLAN